MLQWRIFRSKWLAITWLVFITLLFFLPGSALPKETWLTKIHIDKWLHTGCFALLLFLWRSAFVMEIKGYNFFLFLVAVIYGLMVEIVQQEWVINRDFDLYDLLFDAIGAFLGLFVWREHMKKNKPL